MPHEDVRGVPRLVAVQELHDNRLGIELLLEAGVGPSKVWLPAQPPPEELEIRAAIRRYRLDVDEDAMIPVQHLDVLLDPVECVAQDRVVEVATDGGVPRQQGDALVQILPLTDLTHDAEGRQLLGPSRAAGDADAIVGGAVPEVRCDLRHLGLDDPEDCRHTRETHGACPVHEAAPIAEHVDGLLDIIGDDDDVVEG